MKASSPKIAQVIAADIRMKIVRGELAAGENLPPEARLGELYDVSRPTIREAVRILESERLLHVRRGGRDGAVVQAPDVEANAQSIATLLQYRKTTVADAWEAWSSLECVAIAELVRRAGDTDLSTLRAIVARFGEGLDSREQFAELGLTFSDELVRLAGNVTMLVLFRLLRNIVMAEIWAVRRRTDPDTLRGFRTSAPAFTLNVLDLIERGDPEAVTLWKRHVDEVATAMLEVIGPATIIDVLTLDG